MNNYGYGLTDAYFDKEAELLRREERKWEKIIGDIGERPFYKIDETYFGEEQAIEVLEDEYGQGNYELDQWEVKDDEVYEKYLDDEVYEKYLGGLL